MKKIIATIMATVIVSSSAFACTPRYTSNVGNVMAQVRVQASKAGAAVKKKNEGNNPSLSAALEAAAKAGAAAGAAVVAGK